MFPSRWGKIPPAHVVGRLFVCWREVPKGASLQSLLGAILRQGRIATTSC